MRVLAGDVGATHCRLGLFEVPDELVGVPAGRPAPGADGDGRSPQPELLAYREYPSAEFGGLDPVLHRFLTDSGSGARGASPPGGGPTAVGAACLGVPCPLEDGRCSLPNLDWELDQAKTSSKLGISNLLFINDFTAIGYGIFEVDAGELVFLQEGDPVERATRAVVGPGTGLGTAFLTWCGDRYRVHGSEGGHVGYAGRDAVERRAQAFLSERYGRASRERAVSGPGLVDLYRFRVHAEGDAPCPEVTAALEGHRDAASVVSTHGVEDADPACSHALSLFVRAFGAVAGDVALAYEARGGLYLAGGIAPKIREALEEGEFLRAFRDKGRMTDLVSSVPMALVTDPRVGILGSAAVGRSLVSR